MINRADVCAFESVRQRESKQEALGISWLRRAHEEEMMLAARRASTLSHEEEAAARRRAAHEAEVLETIVAVSASLSSELAQDLEEDAKRLEWAIALSESELEGKFCDRLTALERLLRESRLHGPIPVVPTFSPPASAPASVPVPMKGNRGNHDDVAAAHALVQGTEDAAERAALSASSASACADLAQADHEAAAGAAAAAEAAARGESVDGLGIMPNMVQAADLPTVVATDAATHPPGPTDG